MKTKITAVALAALMVLTIFASVIPASAAEVTSVEIRGTVIDTDLNVGAPAIAPLIWNAANFAAFYYDINKPTTGTEALVYTELGAVGGNVDITLGNRVDNNIIDAKELQYTTNNVLVNYKVRDAYPAAFAGAAGPVTDVTQYGVIGWMAEKYVAIGANALGVGADSKKITKLLLEQGADDKMTLRTGEVWDLGNGYTLTPEQIDVEGDKVWLVLSKDGVTIEDEIIDTSKTTDNALFVAKADFGGKTDIVYFVTYVDAAFRGTATDLVQLKYTWLIDKTDIIAIETGDKFGNFEVLSAGATNIVLENEGAITLNYDDDVNFMGDLHFKVSKLDAKKVAAGGSVNDYYFYPAKDVTVGGEVPATDVPAVEEPEAEEPEAEEPEAEEPEAEEPADAEPAPEAPTPEPEAPVEPVEPPEEEPGFGVILAITGLLAVAYLVRRN